MKGQYVLNVSQNQVILLADQLYELAENFEKAYEREKNSREQFFDLEVSGILGPMLRNLAQELEKNPNSRKWKQTLSYNLTTATWFPGNFDVTDFLNPKDGNYSDDTKKAFTQMLDIDRKLNLGIYDKLLEHSSQYK